MQNVLRNNSVAVDTVGRLDTRTVIFDKPRRRISLHSDGKTVWMNLQNPQVGGPDSSEDKFWGGINLTADDLRADSHGIMSKNTARELAGSFERLIQEANRALSRELR